MTSDLNRSELSSSCLIGFIGGSISGIIIVAVDQVIWVRKTPGFGIWDWSVLGLGIEFGGFFGLLMAPLGYFIFLKNIGIRKAILPAFVGTIAGGCIGALKDSLAGFLYGCAGFFIALAGLRLFYYFKDRSTALRQT